ncbi:MAG: Asp-tRNA(Asn)/Glu-tRNA(Gln) amidotransferase subunit GatB [candidate division Zixibacteria bacterium]|nr:Asp-tRNA(Asn)/Glu-tRNA(Gln) amidotransferase subunit GatB [candidate division Zixibacteria bacterium]
MVKYEAVIGLEAHVQLKTAAKIFCGCSTSYGAEPNTQVCPICLGMPGVLPKLNKKAVEYAIKMILAVGGTISPESEFARKNYLYPDLPKGYQISQFEFPLSKGGAVVIRDANDIEKKIRLNRIHIEEEAGKSFHDIDDRYSFIDFNRCGTPLLEIVSEPDMRTSKEASDFLNKIKQIAVYLDISSGNMNEGAFRCDVNVSVRQSGQKEYGARREIKNMNSFKFIVKAIDYEIEKQIEIIKSGGCISQQTMLWDEKAFITKPMRVKEGASDYRYFPEPDLMRLDVSSEWIEEIKDTMPELPDAKLQRFIGEYKIPAGDAEILTSSRNLSDYYETVVKISGEPKLSANWIMTELMREIKETDISQIKAAPENLGGLIKMITTSEISGKIAKDVFAEMIKTGNTAEAIVEQKGSRQVSDIDKLSAIVEKILVDNKSNVKKYLDGKEALFSFFIGLVMKGTDGRANPAMVNRILKDALNKLRG